MSGAASGIAGGATPGNSASVSSASNKHLKYRRTATASYEHWPGSKKPGLPWMKAEARTSFAFLRLKENDPVVRT
jgi:hypothetical protein